MAPLIASLKNLIRHGNKKQKNSCSSVSASSSTMNTCDSGTALNSAANSPPPSNHSKDRSTTFHTFSRSKSTSDNSKMTISTPGSRSPSSDRAVSAGLAINPCSSETPDCQHDANTLETPSTQHFTVSPDVSSTSNNHNNHHNHNNKCNSYNNTTFAANHNTEAASRMIAEANQQKNLLPLYPGLERFTLLEKMGDGAFSNVYKAHDTELDRIVAIKVVRKYDMNAQQSKHLHRDMKKKPRVTERANILKEVQIMRQLKHPGVVELYDFSESEEHYFLVLELATGGELFHRIVKLTYFSEDLARHVIVQVAQAIRYLHEERGVIHRDIKPENILFEPIPIIPSPPGYKPDGEDKEDEGIFQPGIGGGGIGRVKIADFGLSKIVWDEQTMTPCGTVGYTAPEIVKDERYSKSVDMWALGCVLYTLLVGFPPFYDESIQALTEKVARGQFTFLSPWWDEISSEVKNLISHLLCVNPNERYTIDQFLAHPWIRAGEQDIQGTTQDALSRIAPEISIASPIPTMAENKILTSVAAMSPDYGGPRTPKTPYRRRAENPLSPGIGLKEVFDVSNAVHRMEEESRRRNAGGNQPVENRQRRAFMTQLNEDDEEGESSDDSGSVSATNDDEAIASGLNDVRINGYENGQNIDAIHLQQKEYQRAQEQIAAEKHNQYLKIQQRAGQSIPSHHIPSTTFNAHNHQTFGGYKSSGRSSNTSNSTASTASSSGSRRRRAGFELNMNHATLLKRRAKQQDAHRLTPDAAYQNLMTQQPPALEV
ncbi:hypothetical protein BGX27_009564 [Mortierella sp. AM989]|nr:hypothetical protein BGX27_009564 [Mortierella sp. AM989]